MMYSQNKANRSPSSISSPDNEEYSISLREYIDFIIEGKKTILLTLMFVLLLAVIYLILTPPTYKSDALLQIDKNKALLSAPLRSDVPTTLEESPRAQREVEILRSRSVIGKVVDNLNLTIVYSPCFFPLIGEPLARNHIDINGFAKIWTGLQRWAWGGEKLKVASFDVPDQYLNKRFTLVALDENRFRLIWPDEEKNVEGIIGEPISTGTGETDAVLIKIEGLEAHPGTHFNLTKTTPLGAFDAIQKALTVQEVGKNTELLKVEIKGQNPEQITKIVNDIVNVYISLSVDLESLKASQKLDFLEKQLPVVKARMEKAEQELSEFGQKHGAVDTHAEAETLLKQISEIEILNIQLKQKYEGQRQRQKSPFPDMIATAAQMENLEKKLVDLNNRVKKLPNTQQHIVSLSREVNVSTELYTSLLNSAQEQRIAAAGLLSNSHVVDFAIVPEKPSWPRTGLLLAISTLFGLSAGSARLFLMHSLQRHKNYPALIEYEVGLPLYAVIPHSDKQKDFPRLKDKQRSKLLVSQEPFDISIESLRSLRTSLETSFVSDTGKIIMFSSPSAGMGKTFISTNLSALFASINKRVLIIDADMRNGQINETLSVKGEPGFSDLLTGIYPLKEVIFSLKDFGLDFMPRGRLVKNPTELLAIHNLKETFKQLRCIYDYIIIDSPPIFAATDAAIIGRHTDAKYLVVKEGRHTVWELEVSLKRFQQTGVNLSGFIINDVSEGSLYNTRQNYS